MTMIFYNGFNLMTDLILIAMTVLITIKLRRK
jgi:hypothetical protein